MKCRNLETGPCRVTSHSWEVVIWFRLCWFQGREPDNLPNRHSGFEEPLFFEIRWSRNISALRLPPTHLTSLRKCDHVSSKDVFQGSCPFCHPVLCGFVLTLHPPLISCPLLGCLVESVAQGGSSWGLTCAASLNADYRRKTGFAFGSWAYCGLTVSYSLPTPGVSVIWITEKPGASRLRLGSDDFSCKRGVL